MRLSVIQEHIYDQLEITITYFQPTRRKSGGSYITASGCVKKIDTVDGVLIMRNAKKIPIENILDIAGEMFGTIED